MGDRGLTIPIPPLPLRDPLYIGHSGVYCWAWCRVNKNFVASRLTKSTIAPYSWLLASSFRPCGSFARVTCRVVPINGTIITRRLGYPASSWCHTLSSTEKFQPLLPYLADHHAGYDYLFGCGFAGWCQESFACQRCSLMMPGKVYLKYGHCGIIFTATTLADSIQWCHSAAVLYTTTQLNGLSPSSLTTLQAASRLTWRKMNSVCKWCLFRIRICTDAIHPYRTDARCTTFVWG